MITNILALIKSEQERRNAPMLIELNAKKNKENTLKWFQAFYNIGSSIVNAYRRVIYVSSLKPGPLVIPNKGHKSEEVITELYEVGFEKDKISSWDEAAPGLLTRLQLLIIVLISFTNSLKVIRAKHAKDYYAVILSYLSLKKLINRKFNSSLKWIIIGDLSPYLITLSSACKDAGQKLVYWQYSFLDFKHLPRAADEAVILNNKGIQLSKLKSNRVFWRSIGSVKEVSSERIQRIQNGPIGILLSAQVHEEAWDTIIKIHEMIQQPCEIRFHPRSKIKNRELPEGITISEPTEDLNQFADRISLGICGNTQALSKILLRGTPVLQVAGLDLLDYDFHGYIKKNIVPGIKEPKQFSFNSIESFYQSTEYHQGLFDLIGPYGKDRQPLLSSFNVSNS